MSAPEIPSDSDPRPQAALRLLTGEFELYTERPGTAAARPCCRIATYKEDEAARRSGALAHV